MRHSKVSTAIPVVNGRLRWPSIRVLRQRVKRGTFPEVGEDWLRAYSEARDELSPAALRRKAKLTRN